MYYTNYNFSIRIIVYKKKKFSFELIQIYGVYQDYYLAGHLSVAAPYEHNSQVFKKDGFLVMFQ